MKPHYSAPTHNDTPSIEHLVLPSPFSGQPLSQIYQITFLPPSFTLQITWKYLTLTALGLVICFLIINYVPPKCDDYVYPSWAIGMGWCISISSLFWLPYMAVKVSHCCAVSLLCILRGPLAWDGASPSPHFSGSLTWQSR